MNMKKQAWICKFINIIVDPYLGMNYGNLLIWKNWLMNEIMFLRERAYPCLNHICVIVNVHQNIVDGGISIY